MLFFQLPFCLVAVLMPVLRISYLLLVSVIYY